ncbi:MAG: glycosyl transferase family 1 [Candidatus Leucobacter sulfamidivorax]|nr:glycosyl transferase family 1 [Candidatus Leucobacter sulfamidivorax]
MSLQGSTGLNLLMYPSSIVSSGRLRKLSNSLQSSGRFSETHIVGIDSGDPAPTDELADGVRVVRIPGASLQQLLGGIRIMLFWPFRVYRHYRKQNLSAVAAQNVYLLPLAYHLSRRTGAVMVYNAHELETETIGARGLKQKIAKFIERRYIRHADVVSVVNEPIAEWYSTNYPGIEPIVLTNTPIDAGGEVDLRGQLGIPDGELLYIHVGFLMEGRSIPLLLETFAANPRVHIAFLGDGYLRPEVEQAAAAHPNIHLLPLVAPEEVVSVVRGADAGFCLVEHVSLSDKLSTPNKLMECLAAGVPPLCSDIEEARRRLGPELSRTWILDSPEEQLHAALERIGQQDIAEFKRQWRGITGWEDQAAELVDAYREALAAHSSNAESR